VCSVLRKTAPAVSAVRRNKAFPGPSTLILLPRPYLVYSATLSESLRPSGEAKVNSYSRFQDAMKRNYLTLVIAPKFPAVRASC